MATKSDTASRGASLVAADDAGPSNPAVRAMLTDMYQISMAYAYWRAGKHNEHSVFDAFFRKAPFKGEFAVFAGLEEVLRFVQTLGFRAKDIEFLKTAMPSADPGFFEYLSSIDSSQLLIYGVAEGTVVFPGVPLLRVEGPLALCQLLETTVLNLLNFATLMTTNAARFKLAAPKSAKLIEFGLRRAQGPDGAMSASRYALIGGFDATSNVAAAQQCGTIPVGSHAHSLVSSYTHYSELPEEVCILRHKSSGVPVNLLQRALAYREQLGFDGASNGEIAAFISFATAYPERFIALVDTYDTLQSGVPNFICVALALSEAGFVPYGIRLDSGDLSYLSREARRLMREVDAKMASSIAKCTIMASNDINETVLMSLSEQGHEIDSFGIGTHLVTCQAQPALGMVYKLVEIEGTPRIKLSNDVSKVTLPGAKEVYRLLGTEGTPLMDYIIRSGEARPLPGKRLLARHPFDEKKRAYITPRDVIPLLRIVFKGCKSKSPATADVITRTFASGGSALNPSAPGTDTQAALEEKGYRPSQGTAMEQAEEAEKSQPLGVSLRAPFPTVMQLQSYVQVGLKLLREDHLRPVNPTPYKVAVSADLFHFLHDLWMREVPIPELQ